MKRRFLLFFLAIGFITVFSQSNISVSNIEANEVLFGDYDPMLYLPDQIINHHDSILHGIVNEVSSDTMMNWLAHIETYHNRNTGSDTVSENSGIGAVRRWIHSKLLQFSQQNENRLLVSYLDFDKVVCSMEHHRNVFGVLPGIDTSNNEIVFVEAHYDTRCEGVCDTDCYSPGMDDNGSGTVLVMELARVMSKYAFKQTVVFALTTGEDQGLHGAQAFADYFKDNDLEIRACLNNDVVGGVECGNTSSPPSCPYYTHIDSLNVRIFSYSFGSDSSKTSNHKQLARYMKVHQEEDINPLLNTPLNINIMIKEDRSGRGGDHIPFREKFYPAIRVCSRNEHGDGSGTPPDRQHSTRDILGMDTTVPPDGIIDSFFVDPGYLRRNTILNGVNLGFLAMGPPQPFPEILPLADGVTIEMKGQDTLYNEYRLAIRSKGSGTLDFDTIYNFYGSSNFELTGLDLDKEYYFSVMSVENDIESLPSWEHTFELVGKGSVDKLNAFELTQNFPNPFSGKTSIQFKLQKSAYTDLTVYNTLGSEVARLFNDVALPQITYEVSFDASGLAEGVYFYKLQSGKTISEVRKMILMK